MKEIQFYKNYFELIRAIELCIENKLALPAFSLIYSGIDTFGWLAYGEISPKARFTKWVDEYLYADGKLDAEPIDLYSARCALLHTFTPNSDLIKKNQAKPICYAWGNANLNELKLSIEKIAKGKSAFIHLNDLFNKFKEGLLSFLKQANENPNNFEGFTERQKLHYSSLSKEKVKEYNESFQRTSQSSAAEF